MRSKAMSDPALPPPRRLRSGHPPPPQKVPIKGAAERITELSREVLVNPETGAPDQVIVLQSVDNPRPGPGPRPIRSKKALRVHSISPNKHSPKKRRLNHMVSTAYLRDEPDLRQLARAIALMAEQLLTERRQHPDQDAEPPAKAA